MIAELHGKISSTGSNLHDRLEDQLTGDIFGSLRYLPYGLGIAPVLLAAKVPASVVEGGAPDVWIDRIEFWPREPLGELDVRIDLDEAVIGIEVKYQSPLSSDDDADYSGDTGEEADRSSVNQLSRESRIVREWAGPHKKAFLILVARDSECSRIVSDVTARKLIAGGVELLSVSWQGILLVLERQRSGHPVYTRILEEMTALLKRKKFERFHRFDSSLPAVCAGEYFIYQYSPGRGLRLPQEPFIDGGTYYEFG